MTSFFKPYKTMDTSSPGQLQCLNDSKHHATNTRYKIRTTNLQCKIKTTVWNSQIFFSSFLQCKALNKQDELQRKGSTFIFLVSAIRKNLAETFNRITEIKIRNAGGARGMENYLRAHRSRT